MCPGESPQRTPAASNRERRNPAGAGIEEPHIPAPGIALIVRVVDNRVPIREELDLQCPWLPKYPDAQALEVRLFHRPEPKKGLDAQLGRQRLDADDFGCGTGGTEERRQIETGVDGFKVDADFALPGDGEDGAVAGVGEIEAQTGIVGEGGFGADSRHRWGSCGESNFLRRQPEISGEELATGGAGASPAPAIALVTKARGTGALVRGENVVSVVPHRVEINPPDVDLVRCGNDEAQQFGHDSGFDARHTAQHHYTERDPREIPALNRFHDSSHP
jgi:hypothetical protein